MKKELQQLEKDTTKFFWKVLVIALVVVSGIFFGLYWYFV